MPDLADAPPLVMASWFPADVSITEAATSLRRCRVYITTRDLVVFTGPDVERFRSAVDFAATPEPPALQWPANDLDVHTDAGLVVVRPTGGCGCGHPLKRWQPEWAAHRTPWRAS